MELFESQGYGGKLRPSTVPDTGGVGRSKGVRACNHNPNRVGRLIGQNIESPKLCYSMSEDTSRRSY